MGVTLTVPGARGCGGSRTPGGVYLSCGVSAEGVPIWDFMLDPVIQYQGEKFQGIQVAGPEFAEGWPDDTILLLDMVSKADYSVGQFVRRRVPPNGSLASNPVHV